MQAFHQIVRQPDDVQRDHPISAEAREKYSECRAAREQPPIGYPNGVRGLGGRPGSDAAFGRDHYPDTGPRETGESENAERRMPAVADDDPGDDRGHDAAANRSAACHDAGRQSPLPIRKPLVNRMQRDGKRGPLGGAENHAADEQQAKACDQRHRQQRAGPHQGHRQHQDLGADPVCQKADRDAGDGEQQKERAAQFSESGVGEPEFAHDRHAREADDRLVSVIDQHEHEHHRNMGPSPTPIRLRANIDIESV